MCYETWSFVIINLITLPRANASPIVSPPLPFLQPDSTPASARDVHVIRELPRLRHVRLTFDIRFGYRIAV